MSLPHVLSPLCMRCADFVQGSEPCESESGTQHRSGFIFTV